MALAHIAEETNVWTWTSSKWACAAATPGLRILSRTRVFDFEQSEDGVMVLAKELGSNATIEIFSRYLIGCDGAHSEVRRRIGSRLSGDATLMSVQSSYILAPGLLGMMPSRAWAIDCLNPRSWGLIFAIDGRERWLIHNFLPALDRDRSIREILRVAHHSSIRFLVRRTGLGGA
jgi:2-polyprenyl-6-methoxyphenol hydroxylase-like FAD-dependent oxidoreductase